MIWVLYEGKEEKMEMAGNRAKNLMKGVANTHSKYHAGERKEDLRLHIGLN